MKIKRRFGPNNFLQPYNINLKKRQKKKSKNKQLKNWKKWYKNQPISRRLQGYATQQYYKQKPMTKYIRSGDEKFDLRSRLHNEARRIRRQTALININRRALQQRLNDLDRSVQQRIIDLNTPIQGLENSVNRQRTALANRFERLSNLQSSIFSRERSRRSNELSLSGWQYSNGEPISSFREIPPSTTRNRNATRSSGILSLRRNLDSDYDNYDQVFDDYGVH